MNRYPAGISPRWIITTTAEWCQNTWGAHLEHRLHMRASCAGSPKRFAASGALAHSPSLAGFTIDAQRLDERRPNAQDDQVRETEAE